jgi:hypothetical protein
MKISKQEIGKLFEQVKDEKILRELLQEIFSHEENIETFSEVLFPNTVTNRIPQFHQEIYDFLFNKENGALAAPRGHGKTSAAGLIFITFSIVKKIEQYIVYMSQNHTKTVQFIDPIRYEFKNNQMLKFIYGDLTPQNVKGDDGKDREDCFDVGGCRVEAVSFEKNLRGFKYRNMRPTLIIGDDIESDERILNPELREKDKNKLNKIVIPALDINGRFKMIGTILHSYSLLKNKIDLYKGKIFRACDENMENLLWPDRFTKEKLQKIKLDIGSVSFQQEYLNDPIDNTSSLIKREWIEQCRREDLSAEDVLLMNFKIKTMGADFAFSDRITADESAYAGLGQKDDYFYLLHCQKNNGLSINEQMNILKNELYPKYKYDKIGLEENSIKAISKDINQWNLPITLFWTAANDPADKMVDKTWENKRHTVGKINLIMRLGTAFENKKIVIPYKTEKDKAVFEKIMSECTSYALSDGKLVEAGVHPDIPIALGYALELINILGFAFDFIPLEKEIPEEKDIEKRKLIFGTKEYEEERQKQLKEVHFGPKVN